MERAEQIEGMKKVLAGPNGAAAKNAAEKQAEHLRREIQAMKSLNESYNDSRLVKCEAQLSVIEEALA